MKPTKKVVKNIEKAWVVVNPEGSLSMWGGQNLMIYDTKYAAQAGKRIGFGRHGAIVPCTISYSLKK